MSYSVVAKSYLVEFMHFKDEADVFNMSIKEDFVSEVFEGEENPYTQFNYGSNIGLIAGHTDGTIEHCYVYNGEINVNNGDETFTKVDQNSSVGLVGKVGAHMSNSFLGDDIAKAGDVGTVFFDDIYYMTRLAKKDVLYKTNPNDTSVKNDIFISTSNILPDSLFKEYLIKGNINGKEEYVNKYNMSLDFKTRQFIEGTRENKIGVFDLSTSPKDVEDGDYMNMIETFSLRLEGTTITKPYYRFFYSTAEYRDLDQDANGKWNGIDGACKPTYIDEDILYDPNLDTADNPNLLFYEQKFDGVQTNNYFYDTEYDYLKQHFENKLVDINGNYGTIKHGSKNFGIGVKHVIDGSVKNIEGISFTLKMARFGNHDITNPNNPNTFFNSEGEEVVSSAVYFELSRTANVTIVASNKDVYGSGTSFIGIYNHDVTFANAHSTQNEYKTAVLRKPSYAFVIPQLTKDFNYFPQTPQVNTLTQKYETLPKPNGVNLFAHVFTIPAGRYFITVPDKTGALCYVAVQGQGDQGDYGSITPIYSNTNTLNDVDFLIFDPRMSGFDFKLSLANIYLNVSFGLNKCLVKVSYETCVLDNKDYRTLKIDGQYESFEILNSQGYVIVINNVKYSEKKRIL